MVVVYANGTWLNENDYAIPVDERGHQFGDGVYEVIRVYDGKPFRAKEHWDRLLMSAKEIRIDFDWSHDKLNALMEEGIDRLGDDNCAVYLQVTRGIAPRGHLFPVNVEPSVTMTVRPVRMTPKEERYRGKRAIFLPDERWANCYIKSLNLLPNILAKQTAIDKGFDEAILVRDGFVTEGTASNVYMVKDGQIITTPISRHILYGITRKHVEELAARLEIPFVERHFTEKEMLQADEVFYTSSTIEVMPIVEIDERLIGDGTVGPITDQLIRSFFTK